MYKEGDRCVALTSRKHGKYAYVGGSLYEATRLKNGKLCWQLLDKVFSQESTFRAYNKAESFAKTSAYNHGYYYLSSVRHNTLIIEEEV